MTLFVINIVFIGICVCTSH